MLLKVYSKFNNLITVRTAVRYSVRTMSTQRINVGPIDLKDGQMKEISFPESDSTGKVLLSKVKGQVYATSHKCTHYGARLVTGVLNGETGKIVCPWHGAGFSAKTGDIEDAPGIGCLQSFKVDVEGENVFVTAPVDAASVNTHRGPPQLSTTVAKPQQFGVIVVGGGSAGGHAVEGLREAGYEGSILVVMKEPHLPIDRTKLSKALISDPKKVALRDDIFYQALDVTFELSSEVSSFDSAANTIKLSDGTIRSYDHLILATGSVASRLPESMLKGLKNVFTMRTIEDAAAIDAALGSDEAVKKNVVIIGSSFIGMELALATSKRANVTVLGLDSAPFKAILGEAVGNGIRKFHESNGVKFILPADISHLTPSASSPISVGAVQLKDGTSIPADLVILGVGVRPSTDVLKTSGLELEKDGSVVVDGQMRVKQITKGNVYAAGDIACYPDHITGELLRVEHWNVAANHARTAAKTIAGKDVTFDKVAIFWSAQGQQLRYASTSRAKHYDDIIVQGSPDELKFVTYYTEKDVVVAVASMQKDPVVSHVSELFSLGKMLTKSELTAGKNPLDIALTA